MPDPTETVLSDDDIRNQAEELAQAALGVSASEAWRRVQSGQYKGTLLESNLQQLRWMLGKEF